MPTHLMFTSKLSFFYYALFGCDCSKICLAELQKLQRNFAVSSSSVCRLHKIAVLWLNLSRGGAEIDTRAASSELSTSRVQIVVIYL